MAEDLLSPILRSGIRSTNFFNGRVLTSEDLSQEQSANRAQNYQLGRGLGEGVVYGLEVRRGSGASPTVTVSSGLAFNRLGQAICLPDQLVSVEVGLVRSPASAPAGAGVFVACTPPTTTAVPTGRGFYILACAPAAGYEGKVPKVGLMDGGVARRCDNRYTVEGIQFRLVEITPSQLAVTGDPNLDSRLDPLLASEISALMGASGDPALHRLRSLVSHLCLGSAAAHVLSDMLFDPLWTPDAEPRYSPLDGLRSTDCAVTPGNCLTDCEVPLALIYWTSNGVEFVDMGAVRRSLHRPALTGWPAEPARDRSLALTGWHPFSVLDRRLAESEAALIQFQDQLRAIQEIIDPATVIAREWFRYLPAGGFLPIGESDFNYNTFFQGMVYLPEPLEPAYLRSLVYDSWLLDPIKLSPLDPLDPSLTISPPLRLFIPESFNFLFFLRTQSIWAYSVGAAETVGATDESATGTAEAAPTEEAAAPASGATGSIEIAVRPRDRAALIEALRVAKKSAADYKLGRDVQVYAVDERNQRHAAAFTPRGAGPGILGESMLSLERLPAHFAISHLPGGIYTVYVKVVGFEDFSTSVTLPAGARRSINAVLVPQRDRPTGPSKEPDDHIAGTWIGPGWWRDLVVFEEYIRWPWPPPEVPLPDPVVDPPPEEVQIWLEEMAGYIHEEYPGAPVDPADVRVYVDKAHNPDRIAADPYAYLVFGRSGAYMPMVLVPTDRSLGPQTTIGKSGLPGVDSEMEARVGQRIGNSSLDVMAAAWTGLVSDATGYDAATAGAMIMEFRQKVDELEGSLQTIAGVDAALETKLGDAGYTDAVMLANAAPQEVFTAMKDAGVSLAFAHRLVADARKAVPAEAWSLEASSLGLKESEMNALKSTGVSTLGGLKTLGQDLPAAVAGTGIAADRLASLTAAVNLESTASAVATARSASAPVIRLESVNDSTARSLAESGFANIGALAGVGDASLIAGSFGGDLDRANLAIEAARHRLGLGGG